MNKVSFNNDVLEVVRLIPFGRVTTYGAIASYLGHKRSSRMVGWVLHSSKRELNVPAHRVVNRKGVLTGKNHFSSPTKMSEMLINEGVEVENDLIINFQQTFWDPNLHLCL